MYLDNARTQNTPREPTQSHSFSPRTRPATPLLFVVCLAQFMVILDVAVVNVALPSMRGDLHFSTTGLQWVVNAYTITFAGFLMLGGALPPTCSGAAACSSRGRRCSRCHRCCARWRPRAGCSSASRALQGFGGADRLAGDAVDHHRVAARGSRAQPRPRPVGARSAASAPRRARCSAALLTQALRLAGDLRDQRPARRARDRARPARDPGRHPRTSGRGTSISAERCS